MLLHALLRTRCLSLPLKCAVPGRPHCSHHQIRAAITFAHKGARHLAQVRCYAPISHLGVRTRLTAPRGSWSCCVTPPAVCLSTLRTGSPASRNWRLHASRVHRVLLVHMGTMFRAPRPSTIAQHGRANLVVARGQLSVFQLGTVHIISGHGVFARSSATTFSAALIFEGL